MFDFWSNLVKESIHSSFDHKSFPLPGKRVSAEVDLFAPFSLEEVGKARLPFNSSPGPDLISVKNWNKIKDRCKCKLFTVWARVGATPAFVIPSKTIFLAKKANTINPGDSRPISIASVILRHFHNVLAKRLCPILEDVLDPCQFSFRPKDGLAEAVCRLDDVFSTCKKQIEPLTLALIDLKKAFDSVDHRAIFFTMAALGIQENFINYLRNLYRHAPTKLLFKGETSESIIPTKGVRQGDPLSPLLFLAVFDNVLRAIPDVEVFSTDKGRINHLAYADDLVLMSSDTTGLQSIFDSILPVLKGTGLEINIDKSVTLAWIKDGRAKRLVFDHNPMVLVRNRFLPPMGVSDTFRYLGVHFSTSGRFSFKSDIREKLEVLKHSPLKPQQKLFFLVRFLIPSFLHVLTFSKIQAGSLNKLDKTVRSFGRLVLHLPHDTPKAFSHANVPDGGLGIPSLRWMVPVLAFKRTCNPLTNLRSYEGKTLNSTNQVWAAMKRSLLSTCDGAGLRECSKIPVTSRWVLDGSNLLTGRDYIYAIQIRSNTLYSRARAARGRTKDHQCSRGCTQPETLNHIIQNCYATHKCRIVRHDRVVDYVIP
ncbi:hypothetical protein JTE90_018864 [Oedothorax gibbosus]|uniref:Reverse transcriptase domain-containing protein n=1 Tax=Oedothorax gibbosus TaxID=931172 RepID=A0AAV6TVA1_9ARAC|nr:hypothetical protein JTE90_018864 [Oedothorax gibbosus]